MEAIDSHAGASEGFEGGSAVGGAVAVLALVATVS